MLSSRKFIIKKVATTACFIREESSGGWQISKIELLKCLRSETWACGRQTMHAFLRLFIRCFFDDYMSKLFPTFYLANFVCFYPSKYKAFPPNVNYIFLILPYTK